MKEKFFLLLFGFCFIIAMHFLHFEQPNKIIQTGEFEDNTGTE